MNGETATLSDDMEVGTITSHGMEELGRSSYKPLTHPTPVHWVIGNRYLAIGDDGNCRVLNQIGVLRVAARPGCILHRGN